MSAKLSVLDAGAFVEADGGRRGDVEAFGAAADRDGNSMIGDEDLVGQAVCLIAAAMPSAGPIPRPRRRGQFAVGGSRQVVIPAARIRFRPSVIDRSRTIGRWKTLPALDRTHLPLCGSTESPSSTTASAPHRVGAADDGADVAGLAGLDGSPASRRGFAASTSTKSASSRSHTAKIPGGVVASDSLVTALSERNFTGRPPTRSGFSHNILVTLRVVGPYQHDDSAAGVERGGHRLAPSTRNRPSLRRTDERCSFAYDTTRDERSLRTSIAGRKPVVCDSSPIRQPVR